MIYVSMTGNAFYYISLSSAEDSQNKNYLDQLMINIPILAFADELMAVLVLVDIQLILA